VYVFKRRHQIDTVIPWRVKSFFSEHFPLLYHLIVNAAPKEMRRTTETVGSPRPGIIQAAFGPRRTNSSPSF
jgi:hypothetical protein